MYPWSDTVKDIVTEIETEKAKEAEEKRKQIAASKASRDAWNLNEIVLFIKKWKLMQ